MAKEFAKKFYHSKEWQKCRDSFISERILIDGGMCQKCKQVPGYEVHHHIPITVHNINDTDITLNHNNLRYVCHDCHFAIHREMIYEKYLKSKKEKILTNGYYFDDNGDMKTRKVYIVSGAPASGKNKFVFENKQKGDIVIDLDAIKIALGAGRYTNSNILNLAIAVRDYLYQLLEENNELFDCKNVWIITTNCNKKELNSMANRFAAEIIYLNATIDECINRAINDDKRKNKQLAIAIIEKWFEKNKNISPP